MKTYSLIAFKKRIQVSEAVYKAYYQAYAIKTNLPSPTPYLWKNYKPVA